MVTDPLLDASDGPPPLDRPPLGYVVASMASAAWAGLYCATTWGVVLWGSFGAVIRAAGGLAEGVSLGSIYEIKARVVLYAFCLALWGAWMASIVFPVIGLYMGLQSAEENWRFEQTLIQKMVKRLGEGDRL